MAEVSTRLNSCATQIREHACPGCSLVEVADKIGDVAEQLRWEFDELLTA